MERKREKADEKLIYSAKLRRLEIVEGAERELHKLLDELPKGNKNAITKAKANFIGIKDVARITKLPLLFFILFTNINHGGKRKAIIFGLTVLVYIFIAYSLLWNFSVEYTVGGCLIALLELIVMAAGVYIDERIGSAFS